MANNEQKIGTPVNMLWDKILMLPLSGMIDSARGQEIMETMLNKVIATGAKIIILDILGVPIVDSAVANHLIKITKATGLVGAESIISGISAEIAQTLVHLGVELGDVITTSSMADAVQLAFDKTGYAIKKVT